MSLTKAVALSLVLFPVALSPGVAQTQVPESLPQLQLSFAPVVERAAPAVVNIYAQRVVEGRASPFADDPFFSQLFGGLPSEPRVQNSLGSGVILEGGLVVSNYHVVGGATDIRVVLADRREYDGEIILADEAADLAVIRLDGATDLPALEIADSDAASVGDLVLAIGNPFGVGQTVSSGIVSGLARSGMGGSGLTGGKYFIQTDAPINPGNSGGALVDMQGRLVGINAQIVTRSGGSNGIGFAIPANLVKQVVAQAAAGNASFERPWSGLDVQVVSADLAGALGLDIPHGVMIRDMHPDSPFEAAGLATGDVITALDGQPVNAEAELAFRLATHPLGSTVTLDYIEDGTAKTAEVAIAPIPEGVAASAEPVQITADGPFQGLSVAALTPGVNARAGADQGVIVLAATGMSARRGFRPGDVILTVNGEDITNPDDLARAAAENHNWWRVDLMRGNRRISSRFNG